MAVGCTKPRLGSKTLPYPMPMRKLNMPQEKKAPRAQSQRVFRNPDFRTTRLLHARPTRFAQRSSAELASRDAQLPKLGATTKGDSGSGAPPELAQRAGRFGPRDVTRLSYGLGRSYGDSYLNDGGVLIDTSHIQTCRISYFDEMLRGPKITRVRYLPAGSTRFHRGNKSCSPSDSRHSCRCCFW
jgi:hypothetical protein